MDELRSVVPCGLCRACCRRERVLLDPGLDDVASYETVPATLSDALRKTLGPASENARMLAHKENGDCFYLGENGCTIWDRAPWLCRSFDCRKWFLKFSRADRRQLLAKGHLDRDIVNAARERLPSLKEVG